MPDTAQKPTPYPELNGVLREFIASVHAALGGSLVAACLQGSFAVGDFDRFSDVDFIVAVEEELTVEQVRMLRLVHERIHALDCPWAQHLEGSYFPKDTLKTWRERGRPLWYIDNGSRELVRSDHCNTIVVRWVVRESGVPLAGVSPSSLVDPIPVGELRSEIRDVILNRGSELLANPAPYTNRFYQTYLVLNFSRMLHDLKTGYPGSKRAGAEWARAHLSAEWADLIDQAWLDRQHPLNHVKFAADPEKMDRTLEYVRYVIERAGSEPAQSR